MGNKQYSRIAGNFIVFMNELIFEAEKRRLNI